MHNEGWHLSSQPLTTSQGGWLGWLGLQALQYLYLMCLSQLLGKPQVMSSYLEQLVTYY